MASWNVLVWNMGLLTPGVRTEPVTSYFGRLITDYEVDIALLTEAGVHHMAATNESARAEGRVEPYAFSKQGIRGRDFWFREGERRPMVRTRCSSAVFSPHGPEVLGEDDVRAVSLLKKARPEMPFSTTRPGTWIAASVPRHGERITCIALYGLIEELTDASMHTALSEVSPAFSDPAYMDPLILGGDFNISTAFPSTAAVRARIVLDRIEAYGLSDCLASSEGPLQGCPCASASCRHRRTRLTPDRGKGRPWQDRIAAQVDYLYASETLSRLPIAITSPDPEEWEPFSDHAPLIATFGD